jgi:hypothetical protein
MMSPPFSYVSRNVTVYTMFVITWLVSVWVWFLKRYVYSRASMNSPPFPYYREMSQNISIQWHYVLLCIAVIVSWFVSVWLWGEQNTCTLYVYNLVYEFSSFPYNVLLCIAVVVTSIVSGRLWFFFKYAYNQTRLKGQLYITNQCL